MRNNKKVFTAIVLFACMITVVVFQYNVNQSTKTTISEIEELLKTQLHSSERIGKIPLMETQEVDVWVYRINESDLLLLAETKGNLLEKQDSLNNMNWYTSEKAGQPAIVLQTIEKYGKGEHGYGQAKSYSYKNVAAYYIPAIELNQNNSEMQTRRAKVADLFLSELNQLETWQYYYADNNIQMELVILDYQTPYEKNNNKLYEQYCKYSVNISVSDSILEQYISNPVKIKLVDPFFQYVNQTIDSSLLGKDFSCVVGPKIDIIGQEKSAPNRIEVVLQIGDYMDSFYVTVIEK